MSLIRYCSSNHKLKKNEVIILDNGFYWVKPYEKANWIVVEWRQCVNRHYPNDGWKCEHRTHYDDMFLVGDRIKSPDEK